MKADKASTGKLAPGNAAIKGESAAMKGAPAGALQSPAGR
jgi:hypothetical protein